MTEILTSLIEYFCLFLGLTLTGANFSNVYNGLPIPSGRWALWALSITVFVALRWG